MTERRKNILIVLGLLALLVFFYSRILFTDKIIRAPDIIAEFYWGVQALAGQAVEDVFNIKLYAIWDMFTNSGVTNEGGGASGHFLILFKLIFRFLPLPSSIAWFIVLHIFFGACGVYLCCRVIGASRIASLIGGAVFALAPEIASLINAGHVMKIATISYAPWAFYFLERGFQTRRIIFFLTTAFVLAFQFFNTHWQVSFYTCLCVGAYGVFRLIGILASGDKEAKEHLSRLFSLNVVLLAFFLTTVSISLMPLANWSKDTNRGVQSGSNQSGSGVQKGGLNVEEAMSWSMPPEELVTFVIPGFFGFSRQEGGVNPTNIPSYYWGRMHFTQTVTYMGLLPWLLLPLPLLFRRDRYTWLSLGGIIGGILFSMGKYTPFYWLLFKFLPGINHFRVPKMMMFIPVIGLAILAARGLDLLRDQDVRKTDIFKKYITGICVLSLALFVLLGVETIASDYWVSKFAGILSQPTRYEQGAYLVGQRWNNLMFETGVAAGLSAIFAVIFLMIKSRHVKLFPWLLLFLLVADTWRVNDKFMFLTDAPAKVAKSEAPPIVKFLAATPKTFRTLPMDGSDPMQYVTQGIPVMFASNPVNQIRWLEFLEAFNPIGPMPDIMNVKYLVMSNADYQSQQRQLGDKFLPVFTPSGGTQVVLENRAVLPKAWLVPSVIVTADPAQRLSILQNRMFNPRIMAIVESRPPLAMADPGTAAPLVQNVNVPVYEGEQIVVDAVSSGNALLVLGEKYYKAWQAKVDGKSAEIVPVNHVLRGVYLSPGSHRIEFTFDPLPFKIGKYLTLASFTLFAVMLGRERVMRRKRESGVSVDAG